LRTRWLREKYPPTWVTRELSQRLGVRCTVLPMSESLVRTMIMTDQGELAFQEYFVQKQCQPVVKSIRFAGAEQAQPSREVTSALRKADMIIFCPSNPWLSLDPILALPTMRRIIAASRVPKIGVSPIVGGAALKGPAAKMMAELGLEVSPASVARHLGDVLTGFVLDHVDEAHQEAITNLGLRTLVTGTVMLNDEDRVRLAGEVLEFARK
jgi:LPPG:FO 2-phospho-L-lactate transferase